MFAFRDLVDQHTDELARIVSAEHGKVFDDAKGEVIRGMEVVEFACGIPQLLKGEFSDQVSTDVDPHSFRQPLGVVRRDHAVQLPDHGPDVDAPDGDRHRATRSCSSRPSATRRPRTSSPSSTARPACPTASSTSCTATRSRSTRCSTTRRSPRSRSSARRRSRATSTSAGARPRKRVQALGGAKNHAVVMPDADLDFAADHLTAAGYGSAGQRCMAISVVVAVGDAADPLVERLRRKARDGQGRARASSPTPRWGRSSRPRRASASRGYIDRGVEAGADAGRRRPRARGRRRQGLLRRADAVRPRRHGHGHLHRRDLRARARRRARRHARRGDRPHQRQLVRQRHGDLHRPAGRRRGPSSGACRSG